MLKGNWGKDDACFKNIFKKETNDDSIKKKK